MNDNQKLRALIDHYADGDITTFAQLLQLPRPTITTWLHRGAITAKGRERILDTFADINRDWLLHSDTAMLQCDEPTMQIDRRDTIPYYDDLDGTCGVTEQFASPEYATDFIHIPGIRALAAIPASGDSMEPTIIDGDTVLIAEPVPLASIASDHIYLIITNEGHRMFKRLEHDATSNRHLLAVSDNPQYTPRAFRLDRSSILAIYPVRSVVRML